MAFHAPTYVHHEEEQKQVNVKTQDDIKTQNDIKISVDEEEKKIIDILEKECLESSFSKKVFNKILKGAVKNFISSTHNEEEYAKTHQCDPNKELTRIAYIYEPLRKKNDHNYQPDRVIAMSITYNNKGEVSYGGSIFHRGENEKFNKQQKKNIRDTAVIRHQKTPMRFQLDVEKIGYDSRNRLHFKKIIKQVRKHIGYYGIKKKQLS